VKDKKSKKKLPLYIQIGELLHREIAAGHWLAGERLPVEAELAVKLGVAVGTLRKSLSKLEADGLLERRQGSGTYVKRAPGGQAIYQFFHLELLEGGGAPSADSLCVEQNNDIKVIEQLKLSPDTSSLWCIKRLRFLNRELVAAEQIWFNHKHASQLKLEDLHESLYLHYRENYSFWISRVEDEIDCAPVPAWVSKELGIESGKILPRVQRRGWSNEDNIEEYSLTWFNPDKCRYFARWS